MLKKLREKKNIKMIMFLTAIFIIPAFVLWGVGSVVRSRYKGAYAGKVFSKKVRTEDFLKQYRAVYTQARLLYGDNLPKIQDYLNLEGQTWQRIILLEEAKRRKIKVTDQEVIDWIKSFPLFQRKDKFDKETYETIIKYYLGLNPRQFEEQVRDNLKIKKLIDQVVKDVKVTEEEAWRRYKREHDMYKLSYLLFKPINYYEKVKYKEEDLRKFYSENKELFKKPEQVNIAYIKIEPKEFLGQVEVTEEEIESYYEKNKEEFEKKIEGEDKSDEEKLKEIKEEIRNKLKRKKAKEFAEDLMWKVKEEIKKGASLEEASAKYNLQVVESGFFSIWDPIPGIGWAYNISQKAFSMKEGEVSEGMEIGDTFYIFKVIAKRPPHIPNFEEVKSEVEVKYKNKVAEELAKEDAQRVLNEILNLLRQNKKLEDYLKGKGLALKQTDYISMNKYIPGIGRADEILKGLKIKKPKEFNPEPIKVRAGFLIVRIDEIKEVKKEDFEKEKKEYMERLLTEKKNARLEEWYNQLKERANLEAYYRLKK